MIRTLSKTYCFVGVLLVSASTLLHACSATNKPTTLASPSPSSSPSPSTSSPSPSPSMEPGYVTAAEFSDKWPVANADSAIVFCETPKEVYIKINGTTHPLNGQAMQGSKPDWSWRKKIPLEGFPGEFLLADATPLIERGLKLCAE